MNLNPFAFLLGAGAAWGLTYYFPPGRHEAIAQPLLAISGGLIANYLATKKDTTGSIAIGALPTVVVR